MPEKKNFVLRLDHTTYKALEKWASDEFRSVNGQIEFILNQALKEQFGKGFQERFRVPKTHWRAGEDINENAPTAAPVPAPDSRHSQSPVHRDGKKQKKTPPTSDSHLE